MADRNKPDKPEFESEESRPSAESDVAEQGGERGDERGEARGDEPIIRDKRKIDPVTGEHVELMWVKGSGGNLGTLTEAGLAVLRLDRLRALVDVYPGVDREDEMVAAFDHCLFGKGGLHGEAGAAPRRTGMPSSPK